MTQETAPDRFRVLDGFTLKWIAVISMAIDHFGSIVMDGVLAPYRVNGAIRFTADMRFFIRSAPMIKQVCEALGSVAFPIFCFLLVEGFLHTRDRVRYGLRMGVFAIFSEVPFNLAHNGTIFYPGLQNVMCTLCIGIFLLLLIDAIDQNRSRFSQPKIAVPALKAVSVLAAMGLSYLIRSEYVFLGILTIALLYLLRKNRYWQLLGFAPLLVASPWILLALPAVALYSGRRGRGSKYFFYVFYPAHFLLFAGIAYLLAQRAIL